MPKFPAKSAVTPRPIPNFNHDEVTSAERMTESRMLQQLASFSPVSPKYLPFCTPTVSRGWVAHLSKRSLASPRSETSKGRKNGRKSKRGIAKKMACMAPPEGSPLLSLSLLFGRKFAAFSLAAESGGAQAEVGWAWKGPGVREEMSTLPVFHLARRQNGRGGGGGDGEVGKREGER